MKNLNRLLLILSFSIGIGATTMAQEGVTYANANSIRPIPFYEQLYKQRTWTRVDLEQKQNKGFFTKNKEFTTILIEAVMNDEIQTMYDAEAGLKELEKPMNKEEFLKRLLKTDPDAAGPELQPIYEPDMPYYSEETVEFNGVNYISLKDDNLGFDPGTDPEWWGVWGGEEPEYYLPTEMVLVEIMEDVIFDKRRAREYRDILSVKLIVGTDYTADGVRFAVVTFAYKDLEKFFREHPEKAIWYNQYNSAENRNLADAFLLRLFHGQLHKVGNPDDLTIQDLYGEDPETGESSIKRGLIGAEFLRMKMLEREHNLWSY